MTSLENSRATLHDPAGAGAPGSGERGSCEGAERLGLTSERAKKCYAALLKVSDGDRAKLKSKDGDYCGQLAPATFALGAPELNFDKPEGFVLISRSFPCLRSKEDALKEAAKLELAAAGCPVDNESIQDCVELQKELKIKLFAVFNSKLKVLIDDAIVKQQVVCSVSNKVCQDHSAVCRAFRRNPPSLPFFEKLYNIYIAQFEKEGVLDAMVYEVMMELGLWYAYDRKSLNRTIGGKDAKVSSLRTIAGTKCRELRHAMTEKKTHGVTLTISIKGGRKKRRKRESGFVAVDYVQGWGELQHVDFCRTLGLPDPAPLTATKDEPDFTKKAAPPAMIVPAAMASHKVQASRERAVSVQLLEMPTPVVGLAPGKAVLAARAARKGKLTPDQEAKQWLTALEQQKKGRAILAQINEVKLGEPAMKATKPITKRDDTSVQEQIRGLTEQIRASTERDAMMDRFRKQENRIRQQQQELRAAQSEQKAMKAMLEAKEVEEKARQAALGDDLAQELARKGRPGKKKQPNITNKEKVPKLLPASKAPEDEYVDIVQIHEVSYDDDKFWLLCTEESKSGKYEDSTNWLDAKDVWKICQQFVDEGLENENFVFLFIKGNPEQVPRELAKSMAQMAGLSITAAFPDCHGKFKDNVTTGKAKKNSKKPKSPSKQKSKSPSKSHEVICSLDHDDPTNYKEVLDTYYFEVDRRYSTSRCRGCKKLFSTTANMKRKDWEAENGIPLPKANRFVYACEKFESGACNCGNMLCNSCYVGKLDGSGNSRRRKRTGCSDASPAKTKRSRS